MTGNLPSALIPTTRPQQTPRTGFIPKPHQLAALHALTTGPLGFAHHDRTTAILPSGTGKTLLQWLVAEALHARTILVCLPSLALVQQTIKVWISQSAARPYQGLVVCSDSTITSRTQYQDEWQVAAEDLDFPVTTSRSVIHTFLKTSSDHPRVIFCTYQSLPLLSKLISPKHPLDLGIFDEAHHTAGDAGKPFAIGLHNRSIPIRKRLFLTATPRILGHRESQVSQSFVKASMDDPQLYGPQSYTLGFNHAIDDGLICPYQVVITVVTPNDLPTSLLRSLHNTGDDNTVRAAANLIALAKTMQRYRLRKALTFHHTIREAALYETLQQHRELAPLLQDIPVSHVSGAMTTKDRNAKLDQFQTHERAILTNARCLQEGVDLPTVDLVGFLSPRRSPVDIIQAIGRALRIAPSKHNGYILLPIYQPETDTQELEHTLKATHYDTIWNVLQAIADQDEPLQHSLQTLRHKDPQQTGITVADFPHQITIDHPVTELHRLIQTRVIASLTSKWDASYGELQRYLALHHHFPPPQHPLSTWLNNQRTLYSNSILPSRRVQLLDSVGITWKQLNHRWHTTFDTLTGFLDKNHELPTPPTNRTLYIWLINQKRLHRKGGLAPERNTLLTSLGTYWTKFLAIRIPTWDELLEALTTFVRQHGTLPTMRAHMELNRWLNTQRRDFRSDRLALHRYQALAPLGVFDGDDGGRWEKGLAAFQKYVAMHKTYPTRSQQITIANWIKTQRVAKNNGVLSQERIALLDQIGFVWNSSNSWETLVAQLQQFITTHGTFPIASTHPRLNAWVVAQRISHRRGQLAPHKTETLTQLGMVWNPLDNKWRERYDILQAYVIQHGHLRVRSGHSLTRIISEFRQQYVQGTLPPERVEQLTAIGMDWHPRDSNITSTLALLAATPQDIKNGALNPLHPCYLWWMKCKKKFHQHALDTQLIKQLAKLGLSFDPDSTWPRNVTRMDWPDHLTAIAQCPLVEGVRVIPRTHPSHTWAMVTRRRFARRELPPQQIQALTDIQFPFQKPGRTSIFRTLKRASSGNAHSQVTPHMHVAQQLTPSEPYASSHPST